MGVQETSYVLFESALDRPQKNLQEYPFLEKILNKISFLEMQNLIKIKFSLINIFEADKVID